MNYFRIATVGFLVTISVASWLLGGQNEAMKGFVFSFLLAFLGLCQFYNYAHNNTMGIGLISAAPNEPEKRVFLLIFSAAFIFLPLIYAFQFESGNT